MSDNTFDKEQQNAHTADNVADNIDSKHTISDEELGNEINSDSSVAGTTHLNDDVEEGHMVDKLEEELNEAKDKYLRLVAEFDNYKKRTSKEKQDLIVNGGKDIVKALLDVLDDSERAAKQMEASSDIEEIKQGVSLVFNKLKSTLHNKGVTQMDVVNTEFNPDLHEAITEIPAPTEEMKGKVIDVVEHGYYLNDKIIRHAKVVVGK